MIQAICFSRKRPLQLHGLLTSLFSNIPEQIAMSVLLRTDPEYAQAYSQVRERFPYVHFVEETDFRTDLLGLMKSSAAEFMFFTCDDVVFSGTLSVDHIPELFKRDIIGLSLRLGRNITTGMFGAPMPKPMLQGSPEHRWLLWNVEHPLSQGDWAYPWEVLGTLYPVDFVYSMLSGFNFANPSQLEAMGATRWTEHTHLRTMACFPTSRIVVPTVNLVQTEFPGNGIVGQSGLGPEFLLECWRNGLRMDVAAFARHSYSSWRISDFYMKRG